MLRSGILHRASYRSGVSFLNQTKNQFLSGAERKEVAMGALSYRRLRVTFCLCLVLLLHFVFGFPTFSFADDLSKEDIKEVVKESMQRLFTGNEFSIELKKNQQVMKNMLKTGALSKDELVTMLENIIVPPVTPSFLRAIKLLKT